MRCRCAERMWDVWGAPVQAPVHTRKGGAHKGRLEKEGLEKGGPKGEARKGRLREEARGDVQKMRLEGTLKR